MSRIFNGFVAVSMLALAALAGCVTVDQKTSLKATDSGRFGFAVSSLKPGEKITGIGTLAFPDRARGRIPVVILVHGTAGVGYRERSWADYLQDQGYATFILDYFTPRGVDGRGRNVPRPPEDVWGAIKILSTHPRLDMESVAVMGFSNGGSVTRSSADIDPTSDTNGVLPKAYIMLYGGCHSPLYTRSRNYKPALLYIAGGKDTLVRASTCLGRKEDTNAGDIEVMVIDGAYHLFDGDKSQTFVHPKWGEVTVQADSSATDKARRKVASFLKRVFR